MARKDVEVWTGSEWLATGSVMDSAMLQHQGPASGILDIGNASGGMLSLAPDVGVEDIGYGHYSLPGYVDVPSPLDKVHPGSGMLTVEDGGVQTVLGGMKRHIDTMLHMAGAPDEGDVSVNVGGVLLQRIDYEHEDGPRFIALDTGQGRDVKTHLILSDALGFIPGYGTAADVFVHDDANEEIHGRLAKDTLTPQEPLQQFTSTIRGLGQEGYRYDEVQPLHGQLLLGAAANLLTRAQEHLDIRAAS